MTLASSIEDVMLGEFIFPEQSKTKGKQLCDGSSQQETTFGF
jgi:hypothetical protein